MTLDEAIKTVRVKIDRMKEVYQKQVFDEWALVAMLGGKGKVLHYAGPRPGDFQKTFSRDAQVFAAELRRPGHNLGDFDFTRTGEGTQFDAFVVVGEGLFLVCNNTQQSMTTITQNPLWLSAQVPFVELSDTFRSNPLVFPM